ncbi:hypothetical protein JCM19045_242 [Bacillus sp. JCM 19045]|nr:hypothetical protein JCM19045_242 [Bacillus sp. JCM 19045]
MKNNCLATPFSTLEQLELPRILSFSMEFEPSVDYYDEKTEVIDEMMTNFMIKS